MLLTYDDEGATWGCWLFVAAGEDADGEGLEGGAETHVQVLFDRKTGVVKVMQRVTSSKMEARMNDDIMNVQFRALPRA